RCRGVHRQRRAIGQAIARAAHHDTVSARIGRADRGNAVGGVGGAADVHISLAPLISERASARSRGAEGGTLAGTEAQIAWTAGGGRRVQGQAGAVGDAIASARNHDTVGSRVGPAYRGKGVSGVRGAADIDSALAPLITEQSSAAG